MGTRATVVLAHKDGSFSSIHCGADGYPELAGEFLLNNFNSRKKVEELMAGGNTALTEDYFHKYQDGEMPDPAEHANSLKKIIHDDGHDFIYLYGKRGWTVSQGQGKLGFRSLKQVLKDIAGQEY